MKLLGKKTKEGENVQGAAPEERREALVRPDTPVVSSRAPRGGGGRYIIKKPLLTEKASYLQDRKNQYVFLVHPRANKSEIKKEIERLFDVRVEHVNVIRQPRTRRLWRGHVGFSPGQKKAVVTVQKGKKIEILPT